MTIRRVRFPVSRNPIAAPPKAWADEFEVLLSEEKEKMLSEEGGCAVVRINGPLVHHGDWLMASYDEILEHATAAFASEQDTVVLRINSPGGDFSGSLELARDLRALADKSRKRFVAFTDAQALSAAYAIACVADEIVITDSAFVGSIGVWSMLVSTVAQNKMMGVDALVIASGERKVDRNPNVPITEDAAEATRTQVNAMAALFFDHVSRFRGMKRADVEAIEGAEQFGARAIALGLADKIVNSWSEFITTGASASAKSKGKGGAMPRYLEEARVALRRMAEGDDEDEKKMAEKALKALEKDDEKKDEGEGEGEGKAAAKAEGDGEEEGEAKKKGKAESEGEGEGKAAARGGLRIAASSTDRELDLVARVHALEASAAREKEDAEREKLLASRPDFSPAVRASLEAAPIAFVRNAVANWEKATPASRASANSIVAGGTRGDASGAAISGSDASFIERKMKGEMPSAGVKSVGRTLELGMLDTKALEESAKRLGIGG